MSFLPFKVEYAKSNRAGCKTCKEKIDKDELRIGMNYESEWGVGTNWHHFNCFHFRGCNDVSLIEGFDNITAADQKRVEGKTKSAPNSSSKAPKPASMPSPVAQSPVRAAPAPTKLAPLGPPTKGTHNARIVALLREAADQHTKVHEKRAWEKGAEAIEKLKFEVTDGKQISDAKSAKKVAGIGKGIGAMIDEFLETGQWENKITGRICTGETRANAPASVASAVSSPVVKRNAAGLVEEIPDGLPLDEKVCRVEYAKVKKPSDCMHCKVPICNGEVRFGNRMPSPYYEGMFTRWLCQKCALSTNTVQRISQLLGWDRMGYDCIKEIRESTNEMMSASKEKALKAAMRSREVLSDILLENCSVDMLTEMLEANGVSPSDLQMTKNTVDMALMLSDYMIEGVTMNCPTCNNASLVWCAGRVTCWGFMGGATRCPHKAHSNEVKRFNFEMPSALFDTDWLKDWMARAPSHRVFHKQGKAKATKMELDEPEVKMELDEPEVPEVPGFDTGYIRSLRKQDLIFLLSNRGIEVDKKVKVDELIEKLLAAVSANKSVPPNIESWKAAELQLEASMRTNVGLSGGKSKKRLLSALQNMETLNDEVKEEVKNEPRKKNKRKEPSSDGALPNQVVGEFKEKKAKKERKPAPNRLPPEPGSEILKVHDAFTPRTGLSGRIVVNPNDKVNVYNALFTQVELSTKVNRFYVVQLVEIGNSYHVFTHQGRIGESVEEGHSKGQDDFKLYDCGRSLQAGILEFEKWFFKKSGGCPFHDRHNFEQKPGGYNYIELSAINTEKKAKRNGEALPCKLPPSVANLVQLVFDEDKILKSMEESGVKTDELPLGKLTPSLLAETKTILVQLMDLYNGGVGVHNADPEQAQKIYDAKMEHLSSQYFEKIPTSYVEVLNEPKKVLEKWNLVEMLEDICTGQNLNKTQDETEEEVKHELDEKYESLKTDFRPVDRSSEEFKLIAEYVKNTHGPTHQEYTLTITDLFAVDRDGEDELYSKAGFNTDPQRKLLWHGSRISNWAAIISQGLRIAPPEAPVTGYMFGKGLYFADMVTKSANYCFATHSQPEGIMMLSEVALGATPHTVRQANSNLPKGMKKKEISTKGEGKYVPDPAQDYTFPDGTVVPRGKPVATEGYVHFSDGKGAPNGSLLYNEFIVYKKHQQKARYILRVKFNYKSATNDDW